MTAMDILKGLPCFEHGGRIFNAARELGLAPEEILDFSASINPLGMPESVRTAAMKGIDQSIWYPECDAASLIAELARVHGLTRDHFVVGSGSTELLYLAPQVFKPRRALVVTPSFSEYERSLLLAGTRIDFFTLDPADGFRLDPLKLLYAMAPDTDLILLANPANPSGVPIPPTAIVEIAKGSREQAVVAVDEAFVDFCPEFSVMGRVADHGNLYVLRSLTKFYAIPGLRAGYLAGPPRGIARMVGAQQPWPLSVPALAAAHACLGAEEYRRQTLATLPLLRDELTAGLEQRGLKVYPSRANYRLARLPDSVPPAAEIAGRLRSRGILIRACSNFQGLDGHFLRLAVRPAADNRRLLAALDDLNLSPAGAN